MASTRLDALCLRWLKRRTSTLLKRPTRRSAPDGLSIDDLVAMCGPLLNSLKAFYAALTLAFSALDVLKITLPTSAALKETKDPEDEPMPGDFFLFACKFRLAEMEQKNRELTKELRKKAASVLGLECD